MTLERVDSPITFHPHADEPELRVMEGLMICLEQVDGPAQQRILLYICDRYGLEAVVKAEA